MRKLCVPVSLNSITKDNIGVYIDSMKASGVERVFLCGIGEVYIENRRVWSNPESIQFAINTLKAEGFEVGVWIGGFGHGVVLKHEEKSLALYDKFTPLTAIGGETTKHGLCPYDNNFTAAYAEGVRRLAEMGPDLIMLDDDFRLSLRANFYFGCFCENHLKEYYRRLGEEIPRDAIERLIYTGGKNKYRDTFRGLMRDTLLDFAKTLRDTVDSVNPSIRLGACTNPENWDSNGTDVIEIARTFAGKNKPITRVCGAPYKDINVIPMVDNARVQFKLLRDAGVEAMAEGDVYPRPRYNVPSKQLELYDLLLIAGNEGDGILNYVYDYNTKPEYETGYADRYIHNAPLRQQIAELVAGKKTIGVEVFQTHKLIENWDFPQELIDQIARRVTNACLATSRELLSKNTVPITFDKSDYPLFIAGENAKYIDLDALKRGAVLDIKAADILSRRGIDTGFVSEEPCMPQKEYFICADDTIFNVGTPGLRKIVCSEKCEVLSRFLPENTPSAYKYENAQGLKFFVLAFDFYASEPKCSYFNSYYRQEQLIDGIEWVGGKKLPAKCLKNPNLYMVASRNEEATTIVMGNVFLDDVLAPVIQLDKAYSEIKFVNCSGRLEGDKVFLSDIAPYAVVAFEVR